MEDELLSTFKPCAVVVTKWLNNPISSARRKRVNALLQLGRGVLTLVVNSLRKPPLTIPPLQQQNESDAGHGETRQGAAEEQPRPVGAKAPEMIGLIRDHHGARETQREAEKTGDEGTHFGATDSATRGHPQTRPAEHRQKLPLAPGESLGHLYASTHLHSCHPRLLPSPKAPSAPSTRERLLAAAEEVFARQGLIGATTREISQAAGVNEVTLFRQFQHKQNLLAAVIERVFAVPPETAAPAEDDEPLTAIVSQYAHFYRARLHRNLRLIRVLIGEIQHCDDQARQIVKGVFHPQWQAFVDRLSAAQKRGLVREELDPVIIADQLGGMVLTSVLKSDMPMARRYPADRYLEACVEMVVRGIAKEGSSR